MGKKHWIEDAQHCLEESLVPVPHEVNELDWKVRLSEQKERLTEHLIASSNHPDGACLVFGVADDGAHSRPPVGLRLSSPAIACTSIPRRLTRQRAGADSLPLQ